MKKVLIAIFFTVLSVQAQANYSYDVLLVPNETQIIPNWFNWTITGQCQIETQEEVITLEMAVKGRGSVDGHKFHENEVISVNAHNGDNFTLTAGPNAVLKITKVKYSDQSNNTETAIAHCHL